MSLEGSEWGEEENTVQKGETQKLGSEQVRKY